MKNITRFSIAFGILIAVYVFFFAYTYYTDNIILQVSNTNNNEIYTIEKITEYKNKYNITAYYPVTKKETINKYILNNINKHINNFKNRILIDNNVEVKKTLTINFNVDESNNYRCFIFNIEENAGGLHPLSYVFTVNTDKYNEEIITINILINRYKNYLVNLSKYCYNKLKKDNNIQKYSAESLLELGTKASKENYNNYILRDKSIEIIFNQTQVAPYVLGQFRVNVPLEYLDNN